MKLKLVLKLDNIILNKWIETNMSQEKNVDIEFDSAYFFALLVKYKLFVLTTVLLSVIVSGVIAFNISNRYTAIVNAVPPQSSGSAFESAASGISSALKDFGLSKLGGSGADGYAFIVLMQSETVKDSIINRYHLDKVYDIPKSKYSELIAEFDANFTVNLETDGNYTISVSDVDPKRASEMANKYIEIVNYFAQKMYHSEQKINREYMEQRLLLLDSTISKISFSLAKLSKDKMLFSPTDQAKALSSALAEIKAQIIKYDIQYEMYKSNYGEADDYTQMAKNLLEQTKSQYQKAITQPGFAGNFTLSEGGAVGVDYMKLYTELEAYSKAKGYLFPLLEKTRLDERKSVKSLFILDPAKVPDKKSYPKRSIIIAGSAIGGFAISVIIILIINGFRDMKRKYNSIIENI